jgi:hypothetical protein
MLQKLLKNSKHQKQTMRIITILRKHNHGIRTHARHCKNKMQVTEPHQAYHHNLHLSDDNGFPTQVNRQDSNIKIEKLKQNVYCLASCKATHLLTYTLI